MQKRTTATTAANAAITLTDRLARSMWFMEELVVADDNWLPERLECTESEIVLVTAAVGPVSPETLSRDSA